MIINRCPYCMEDMGEKDICPHCHKDSRTYVAVGEALPCNTILQGKYLIGSVMGKGGFGITYIGYDLTLNIKVAIKEYFPSNYASRSAMSTYVNWSRKADLDGVSNNGNSFLSEARKMAKVDELPGMVRVRETFMDNDTAYIVMDYVEGITLKKYLEKNGILPPAVCINVLRPIMESLSSLHKKGIIHRDISPDNIMIQPDGTARLLDLGAAFDTNMHENNDGPVSKRFFSPPEQYLANGKVGAWTDVYALCATIYYCITGTLVPDSVSRVQKDTLQPVVNKKQKGFAKRLTKILYKGLALKPEDRYQSVEQLDKALNVLFPKKGSFKNTLYETVVNVSDIPSDPIGGTVGAILGSLIGVAVWVILAHIGIISWISGLVTLLCALKGYQIMGGSMDKKARWIALSVTIIMLFIGNYFSYALEIYLALKSAGYSDISFVNVFQRLFAILEEVDSLVAFWEDLLKGLLLAVIALLSNIRTTKKNKKLEASKVEVKSEKRRNNNS